MQATLAPLDVRASPRMLAPPPRLAPLLSPSYNSLMASAPTSVTLDDVDSRIQYSTGWATYIKDQGGAFLPFRWLERG